MPDRVPGWVVKLHTMPLSLLEIVDHRIWLRNSHNVASPAAVGISPALATAVHRYGCVYRLADIPRGSAADIQEGVPVHNRGSNVSAVPGQPEGSDHTDQFELSS